MNKVLGARQLPGIGRILHVFGPGHHGPRPGIVVSYSADVEFKATGEVDRGEGKTEQVIESVGLYRAFNINMFADGRADAAVLKQFRDSTCGNTVVDCPVFDPLDDISRDWIRSHAPNGWWAEWPPRD